MPAQKEVTADNSTFEADMLQVLGNIRNAISKLISSLPGSPRRPNDIGKLLDIDRNLAWKMSRVVSESDAFGAAGHIPGSNGIGILIKAAARHDVPKPVLDSLRAAANRYEELIAVHAGDRASLQLLLSGQSRKSRHQAEITHRRAAFRANSFLLGIQAHTYLRADFINAGEKSAYDIGSLKGLIDLRRIRPNAPFIITQPRCAGDDGVFHSAQIEPIERDPCDESGVPLLRKFSSQPPPTFHRVAVSSSHVEYRLDSGPVGKAGAITCISGVVGRSVEPVARTPSAPYAGVSAVIRTPCEIVVFDKYIHEDLFGLIDHEAAVYSDIYGPTDVEGPAREEHRLPCDIAVEYLGKGPNVVLTPDVPRYPEMAAHVFERLGWPAERFDVFRVRIQFPFIPSSIYIRHKLPGLRAE